MFKQIPLTKYSIDEKGQVYSLSSKKFLTCEHINSAGYPRIQIMSKGKRTYLYKHITMVMLFGDRHGHKIPEGTTLKELGWVIDHVDGNKQNNDINNLEIVNKRENTRRYYRNEAKRK